MAIIISSKNIYDLNNDKIVKNKYDKINYTIKDIIINKNQTGNFASFNGNLLSKEATNVIEGYFTYSYNLLSYSPSINFDENVIVLDKKQNDYYYHISGSNKYMRGFLCLKLGINSNNVFINNITNATITATCEKYQNNFLGSDGTLFRKVSGESLSINPLSTQSTINNVDDMYNACISAGINGNGYYYICSSPQSFNYFEMYLFIITKQLYNSAELGGVITSVNLSFNDVMYDSNDINMLYGNGNNEIDYTTGSTLSQSNYKNIDLSNITTVEISGSSFRVKITNSQISKTIVNVTRTVHLSPTYDDVTQYYSLIINENENYSSYIQLFDYTLNTSTYEITSSVCKEEQQTKLIKHIYDKYKDGLETAIIKCSINKYYNQDGSIAISDIDSSKNMYFNIGDIVLPMYNNKGVEEYMSKYEDNSPKLYKVTGVNIIYDGVVMQELTLQEYKN